MPEESAGERVPELQPDFEEEAALNSEDSVAQPDAAVALKEPKVAIEVSKVPLMPLEEAIEKIPATLRKEMEELLRAEFSDVIALDQAKLKN